MSTVLQIHNQAMDLAEEAAICQRRGAYPRATELLYQAFKLEQQAAEMLVSKYDAEPTRSVLYRSAASLALDCKDFPEAERLIAEALSGNPPAEIAEELRNLREQVYDERDKRINISGELRAASAIDKNQINMSSEVLLPANRKIRSKETLNHPKILVVDNNLSFSNSLREFLELQGYEVRTATDAITAKNLSASEDLALIIIDIRLIDDQDEKDESGLTLAKQLDPHIPKIILTAFPTFQDAREMLRPGPDGAPIAVGFVAKQEGLAALLTSIRLALAQLPSTLEKHLLWEFQAPSLVMLRKRLADLGVRDSIQRLQAAEAKTADELTPLREKARQRAAQLHKFGLLAKTVALTLLAAAIVSLLLKATNGGIFSAIAVGLAEGFDLLCSKQEKQALKRADKLHEELCEAEQDRHLMLFCEVLEDPQGRDEYRKKIIDFILLRRSA